MALVRAPRTGGGRLEAATRCPNARIVFEVHPELTPAELRELRENDLTPVPPELELYARVEDLVGEEARLLKETRAGRSQERRERLRAISEELDRIWETLRQRAEHLGRDHASPHPPG